MYIFIFILDALSNVCHGNVSSTSVKQVPYSSPGAVANRQHTQQNQEGQPSHTRDLKKCVTEETSLHHRNKNQEPEICKPWQPELPRVTEQHHKNLQGQQNQSQHTAKLLPTANLTCEVRQIKCSHPSGVSGNVLLIVGMCKIGLKPSKLPKIVHISPWKLHFKCMNPVYWS